ncbi:7 transmembrane receptor [Opisthorchis viverrini]|uniref:7 transmembrane receptor n=1 Tax=Opisthorchis viverrini TaxID=6198 RepID=A0A1S8X8R8_OPIVI|nr:7 transmembrane receptor [Opisthorchis viverrini]
MEDHVIVFSLTELQETIYIQKLGVFMCSVWESRSVFWFIVLLSEINLVCIAVDRLRAIVFSTNYKQQERQSIVGYYSVTFVYASVIAVLPIFMVTYKHPVCIHRLETQGRMEAIAFAACYIWLIAGYLVPGIIMALCYVRVICALRSIMNKKSNTLDSINGRSQASTSAHHANSSHRSIVIPVVIMWTVFLITHAYYVVYNILTVHQIIYYQSNSIERRLSIFLTVVNSACNPMILLVSSPPLRKRMNQFLLSLIKHGKPIVEDQNMSLSHGSENAKRLSQVEHQG